VPASSGTQVMDDRCLFIYITQPLFVVYIHNICMNNKQRPPVTFPDDGGSELLRNIGLLFHVDVAGRPRFYYSEHFNCAVMQFIAALSLQIALKSTKFIKFLCEVN
jgi:hypothetical protein